ncbi:hypothetical protein Tco_1354658 [Tanacetum coccineum]
MFKYLSYIDGRLLFMHFRILGESLDEGLLPLMSDEHVIIFLEYVPRFKKVEVYGANDKYGVESVSQAGNDGTVVANDFHMDELLLYEPNEVDFEHGMEELLYYDIDDGASISVKEGDDVPTWFTLDELDQIIEAQDVCDLFAIYDQPIDDEGDVVPVEVVDEEIIKEEAFDEGVLSASSNRDVIPTEMYDAMVAQEMLEDDDGDVIPTKVYDEMVAQEMLEDQTRSIKRRRVMADKEDEDDTQ